ncbi:RNA polymerase II-associated [Papiliotrema laurentii]|uniref:RNA polymerase II-associated n=1 Tax=Papiliotrema laurentii TaxID=5418 RepID=A0AAD9FVZ5_PAPLA|nr:RNA polymerase II-associated [Papiliotrema laurentii]
MSSKKSRLDLLVRVRYLNPIPPPPFPPKLFNVPTDVHRLGEPSYLDHLASSAPLPMLVDAEMGMPLNLNEFTGVWENADSTLNPDVDPARALDPTDALLLAPIRPVTESNGENKSTAEVSWMRNSTLFTRKTGAKKKELARAARSEPLVDASLAAQIMAIDKSFVDLGDTPVEEMRHPDPKKSSLRVVETYDILPDAETWGNAYYLIKFPERPSGSTAAKPSAGASSPRLGQAVLRPVREDDQQLMEYYLPEEEHLERLSEAYEQPISSEQLEELRTLMEEDADDPRIDDMFKYALYDRIRTYEVVSQDLPKKEVLLTIDERPSKRARGAYYKDINMRTSLRKTRVNGQESWDKTRVGFRDAFEDEMDVRRKAAVKVSEPGWVNEQLREIRGTNEAEGLGEAI